jgi:glycogen synthase
VGPAVPEITFHVARIGSRRRVVFVESPRHFDRPGMYGEHGADYPDNDQRFGLLAHAALEFAEGENAGEPYDVVHTHDWQSGVVNALIRTEPTRWTRLARAGLVFTIHNLAYQGFGATSASSRRASHTPTSRRPSVPRTPGRRSARSSATAWRACFTRSARGMSAS